MAGGAGTGLLAGVFDLDVVIQQDIAQRTAFRRVDDGAVRAKYGMG
jgi:hypothetical protein